jgi:hypothetical protein
MYGTKWTKLTILALAAALTTTACSPGPVPVSRSPRDPSNPAAPEGSIPAAGQTAPLPAAPAPAHDHAHAHPDTHGVPPAPGHE